MIEMYPQIWMLTDQGGRVKKEEAEPSEMQRLVQQEEQPSNQREEPRPVGHQQAGWSSLLLAFFWVRGLSLPIGDAAQGRSMQKP